MAQTTPTKAHMDITAGQITGAVGKFLEALASSSGDRTMPMQQIQLLVQLYVHGPIEQTELEKYTGVNRSANSRNVAKLGPGERPAIARGLGWVENHDDPTNRTKKVVRLTPLGTTMVKAAAESAAKFLPK